MDLNWSTFLLEIVNFLVLLWILKHFLYKPVLEVIARRRAGIAAQLTEAHDLRTQAEDLKAEYENRLSDWERERQQARTALAQELDEERGRRLSTLRETLQREREKIQVTESRQRADEMRKVEQRAMEQAAQFATRLLAQATGAGLEARLVDIAIEDLGRMSGDQIETLRTQWGEPPKRILVSSAFSLDTEHRRQLDAALHRVCGIDAPVEYGEDPTLLAGLRVNIGAWVLQANLQNELKGFTEFAHGPR